MKRMGNVATLALIVQIYAVSDDYRELPKDAFGILAKYVDGCLGLNLALNIEAFSKNLGLACKLTVCSAV